MTSTRSSVSFTRLEQTDHVASIVVLLGGEAGLRCGEMMALEWGDVDLGKRQLCVARSDWKGHVTDTKGGRVRYVPLTTRLATALSQGRHLRSQRVLSDSKGQPLTQKEVQVIDASGGTSRQRETRRAYPATHLLFPSGNARGARQSDSGTGRPSGLDDDAAVYAPQSSRAGCCDPAARSGHSARHPWSPRGGGGNWRPKLANVLKKSGGGGGSRTRVRKHVPAGLYMRVRF